MKYCLQLSAVVETCLKSEGSTWKMPLRTILIQEYCSVSELSVVLSAIQQNLPHSIYSLNKLRQRHAKDGEREAELESVAEAIGQAFAWLTAAEPEWFGHGQRRVATKNSSFGCFSPLQT